jgi:hypothetical protein
VQKGSGEEQACREAYRARFAEAAPLLEFGDLSFFAIPPSKARLFAGFPQAMTVTAATLAEPLR